MPEPGKDGGLRVEDVPGVKEAGWKPAPPPAAAGAGGKTAGGATAAPALTPQEQMQAARRVALMDLQAKLGAVLKAIKNVKDAWPFLQPVNGKLVPVSRVPTGL